MNLFNIKHIKDTLSNLDNNPFDHCVIDNFFLPKVANNLSSSFPKYRSNIWHIYKSKIEHKKTCNNWNSFDNLTYEVFRQLNSELFVDLIGDKIKCKLLSDPGLCGGWLAHTQ